MIMITHSEIPESSVILQKIRHFCSYHERCIADVEKKLRSLAVQGKKIPGIINQLQSEDYLDEERFARMFAGGKFRLNKWGRRKIELELKIRGVPELIIMEALLEIEEEDYLRTLKTLMMNKFNEIKHDDTVNIREKIINFALGKGYEMDRILALINEMKL